jgi:hypothetical protein
MSGKWQPETALLADEKQREAHISGTVAVALMILLLLHWNRLF